MQITRQADYAVRAVLYLARLGPNGRAITARIAHEQHIPPTFLAKIISQLSAAGVVRAIRGANGGVALARPAEQVSLLEIVEAIDGPVILNGCLDDPTSCPLSGDCPVCNVWREAQAKLVEHLRAVNFGALAQNAGVQVIENFEMVSGEIGLNELL
jgi:Rrf2 family protein